jgi:multidrug efflux pump subunit AcrA (membrane-fusion protein)
VNSWVGQALDSLGTSPSPESGHASHGPSDHDHAGHEHAGGDELNSLQISEQARKNIGLKLGDVQLGTFERSIAIPGIVVERPGRSTIEITAPFTGIVTRIYPIRGEAVDPGQPLFEMRLTHEELVQAQADFLRTAEELNVIGKEVRRLEVLTADGGVAGKVLLERKYEQQKQEAVHHAQRQALLLHGLSPEQVDDILANRKLLQSLRVDVPASLEATGSRGQVCQVRQLNVERGQHVTAGESLAILTDHAQLFIEGNAFERDVPEISQALEAGRRVTAVLESAGAKAQAIPGLEILYLSGEVDPESRAFHFYVTLTNELLRDIKSDDGHRFVNWRFKPGQRMQLQVPVETWAQRIVLPIEAVAQDGVEMYVFQANGEHFERRPVHVEYRDTLWAVIANDGSIFPGDTVAMSGAAQLQLALKNKAGGGIDPHAGHNH